MRRTFYIALVCSGALTSALAVLCFLYGGSVLITLTTTVGTTFFHFAMRLCVGYAVEKCFPKKIDLQGFWFREHRWEKGVYKRLRVRKWAKKVPTFKPEQFDLNTHTYGELARQMCLSEVVHEVIVLCGFLSLLFCLFFEDPLANLAPFLITAILAGLYDLQFVILQRYNRPRVVRLMQREGRRSESK